jgi:hypothetical protein
MTYKLVSSYELTYKTLSYCTTLRRRCQAKTALLLNKYML